MNIMVLRKHLSESNPCLYIKSGWQIELEILIFAFFGIELVWLPRKRVTCSWHETSQFDWYNVSVYTSWSC